jgi:hypothetical protein
MLNGVERAIETAGAFGLEKSELEPGFVIRRRSLLRSNC